MRYQVGENSHRIGLGQLRPLLPSALSHQLSRSISPVSGHYAKSNSFTEPYGNISEVGPVVGYVVPVSFARTRWNYRDQNTNDVDCIDDTFDDASSETLRESNLLRDCVNCFFKQHSDHTLHATYT